MDFICQVIQCTLFSFPGYFLPKKKKVKTLEPICNSAFTFLLPLCVCPQVGVLITFLLLLIFSRSVIFLFVGTASLGLFLSSTFPSMLAYTEDILQYQGEQAPGRQVLRSAAQRPPRPVTPSLSGAA